MTPFRPTLAALDRLIARLETRAEAGNADAKAEAERLIRLRAEYRERQRLRIEKAAK